MNTDKEKELFINRIVGADIDVKTPLELLTHAREHLTVVSHADRGTVYYTEKSILVTEGGIFIDRKSHFVVLISDETLNTGNRVHAVIPLSA